jgi:hypothetical protein
LTGFTFEFIRRPTFPILSPSSRTFVELTLVTNNATIFPIGIAEGVFTKILGSKVSADYLVIECVGKGQIMLGRSLLKLLGATIDVGKSTIRFISPPCNSHVFPRVKSKGKKGRRKASGNLNASLDIT